MAVIGFNIGSTLSLGDIGLAVDYLSDKEAFEPDLQVIKQRISGKVAEEFRLERTKQDFKQPTLDDSRFEFGSPDMTIVRTLREEVETEKELDTSDEEVNLGDIELDLSDDEVNLDDIEIDTSDSDEVMDEDDIEIDLSDLEDYEDTVEDEVEQVVTNVVKEVAKETATVNKDIPVKHEVQNVETNDKWVEHENDSSELLDREIELRRRMNNISRQRDEAKKKELQLLEEEILEAEREIELERSKKEALDKQQNRVKTTVASGPSKDDQQRLNQQRAVQQRVDTRQTQIRQEVQQVSQTSSPDKYSSMDIEALYAEVRMFMQRKGVAKSIVDKKMIEAEFGILNIKKLILKSYLISIGKGVTIGK